MKKTIVVALVSLLMLSFVVAAGDRGVIYPLGDITYDGAAEVVDVQCMINAVLEFAVNGDEGTVPSCAGHLSWEDLDISCDGDVNINDILLVISSALGEPLSPLIDENTNGLIDLCEA